MFLSSGFTITKTTLLILSVLSVKSPVSMAKIPKSLDKTMDKAYPSGDAVQPGISLRNGPVEEMDVDQLPTKGTQPNGAVNGKRKGRQSLSNGKSYKESTSDEEDDKPLVCPRD